MYSTCTLPLLEPIPDGRSAARTANGRNFHHQRDSVIAEAPATERQDGRLDGLRHGHCGQAPQPGDHAAEPLVAVQVTVKTAAGLGDTVGKHDQAVAWPQ